MNTTHLSGSGTTADSVSDMRYTTRVLTRLVEANSVNPDLEAGGPGEVAVAAIVASELGDMGADVTVDELAPGRVNVTGIVRGGRSGGRNLMLNGHMDTVGIAGMDAPFAARIEDGKLFGRGAYDMKSGLAGMLGAARRLVDSGDVLAGDLVLTFVADEEYESIGALAVAQQWGAGAAADERRGRVDAAIVTEPTDMHICPAHRGFAIYRIVTTGRTAHGGRHQDGRDANTMMGLLLAELHGHARVLPRRREHELCGSASIHVPLVEGGRSLFIYSHECRIMVERRTLPGETEESVREELEALVARAAAADPDFEARIELEMWRSPWEIDHAHEVVMALERASVGVEAFRPGFIGHGWWEDSAILGAAGIPSVVMGAAGGGIHQDVEWADLDSVAGLAELLYEAAREFCGVAATAADLPTGRMAGP